MTTIRTSACLSLLLCGVCLAAPSSSGKPEKLSAEEIVRKHLAATGTSEARAAVSSRSGVGTAEFHEVVGGRIHLTGTAQLLSQAHKVKWAFRFAAAEYPGEQLVFDGLAVRVAGIDERNRSRLGNFLWDHSDLLREGVWGGVLSTGWTLADLAHSGAKLKSSGTKTINGRELYDVSYLPKAGNPELGIHLYFDSTTFHHVLTLYRFTGTAGPADPGQTASVAGEVVTVVEERFDDFHEVDGITLPSAWEIRLRIEPSKGFEYQWKVELTKVEHNKL